MRVLVEQLADLVLIGEILGLAYRVNQDGDRKPAPWLFRFQDGEKRADRGAGGKQPQVFRVGKLRKREEGLRLPAPA